MGAESIGTAGDSAQWAAISLGGQQGRHAGRPIEQRGSAGRAVGAAPRQHDGDGALAVGGGNRFDEDVGGGADELDVRPLREPQRARDADEEVLVWWGDVDDTRTQKSTGLRPGDGERGARAQELHQMAGEACGQVLDDEDGQRKVGRQRAQDLAQSVKAAERGRHIATTSKGRLARPTCGHAGELVEGEATSSLDSMCHPSSALPALPALADGPLQERRVYASGHPGA